MSKFYKTVPAAGSGSVLGSGEDLSLEDCNANTDAQFYSETLCRRIEMPLEQRDLMVFAREKYSSDLEIRKVLHQLYKKRRLRRTIELRPSLYAPVQACLLSVLSLGIPIFKCNSYNAVLEAVERSLKRCSFLHKWTLPDNVRDFFALPNTNPRRDLVQEAMQSCLKYIWDLNKTNANQITDPLMGPILLEAVKLLMVLKSLEVYDYTVSMRNPLRPFYAQLFLKKYPKDIMEDLASAGWTRTFTELEMALMAESLGIRLDVFNMTANRPNVAAVYPDKMVAPPSVTIVQLDSESLQFIPLLCNEDSNHY